MSAAAPALTARLAAQQNTLQSRQFDAIVHGNYCRVYSYAYRLTRCDTRAEDLTQETFLRAYRAFATYQPARPLLHWLLRITRNLFIDGLRARPEIAPLSLDAPLAGGEGEGSAEIQIGDERFNPEQVLLRDTLDERLECALRSLPAAYRLPLLLCDAQGMTYEETAAQIGCSLGTIRTRIHRGRKLLQKAYAAQGSLPPAQREPTVSAPAT